MFDSNATYIDERENHFRSSKLSAFNNPGVMKQARKYAASIDLKTNSDTLSRNCNDSEMMPRVRRKLW